MLTSFMKPSKPTLISLLRPFYSFVPSFNKHLLGTTFGVPSPVDTEKKPGVLPSRGSQSGGEDGHVNEELVLE